MQTVSSVNERKAAGESRRTAGLVSCEQKREHRNLPFDKIN